MSRRETMSGGSAVSAGPVGAALLAETCRPIPDASRHKAGLLLTDWIGCVLAARNEPVAAMLSEWAAPAAPGPCWTPGGALADPERAAFVNGGLGNVLEMDDLHAPSLMHAGDVVIPAALAVAQSRNAAPAALLEAIVAGYQVALRIGAVAAQAGYGPWVNSSACGVFGAATAAARLLGLGATGRHSALGLAGMQASGLWQCRLEPGEGKQLATAQAARAGVTAARLAGLGMQGPREMIEGPLGFLRSLYPQADPAGLGAHPDPGWKIDEVSLKPWPACRHTHPAIAAALACRDELAGRAIARVTVSSYRAALDFCDTPRPATPAQARFSLQHMVAVALRRGTPTLEDQDTDALRDPALRALRGRTELRVDPALDAGFPRALAAQVRVEPETGAPASALCPVAPGDPAAPLDQATLAAKFARNLAHGGVTDAAAARCRGALARLAGARALDALSSALAACTAPHNV